MDVKGQPQLIRLPALFWVVSLVVAPAVAAQRMAGEFRQDRQQRKEERREQRQQRPPQREQRPQGNAGRNRPFNPPPARSNPQPPPSHQAPPSGGQSAPPRDFSSPGNHKPGPPFGSGAQASLERLRNMSPQDRERVLQNNQRFNSLSSDEQARIRQNFQRWDRLTPQQKDDLRVRERNWRNITPEQREHIRTGVLPRWQQMPAERRQAIQQRLQILQNMPESARNQRLNDPNFTRGMSAEDQAMLRELAHLHVGGAPEPPPEP